jgi:hypothetical protein
MIFAAESRQNPGLRHFSAMISTFLGPHRGPFSVLGSSRSRHLPACAEKGKKKKKKKKPCEKR